MPMEVGLKKLIEVSLPLDAINRASNSLAGASASSLSPSMPWRAGSRVQIRALTRRGGDGAACRCPLRPERHSRPLARSPRLEGPSHRRGGAVATGIPSLRG